MRRDVRQMLFTGHYDHLIDEKNRLSIPSGLRNQMDPEADGKTLFLVPGPLPKSLWLYPKRQFYRISERLTDGLRRTDEQLEYEQALYGMAEELTMDASGRIVLPAQHLELSGLGREITICGVRDHLEIVDRQEFSQRKRELWKNYAEIQRRARGALSDDLRQSGHPAG